MDSVGRLDAARSVSLTQEVPDRASLGIAMTAQQLLTAVVDHLRRTAVDGASVWLVGESPVVFASTESPALQAELRAGLGDLISSAGSVPDWLAGHQVGRCVRLPMTADGADVGGIAVTRHREPFSPAETDLVAVIAALLGLAVVQQRRLTDTMTALEETRRQAEFADNISDAMIFCNPTGQILTWNAAAEQIYGYPQSEALGCDLFALLATEVTTADRDAADREAVFAIVAEHGAWHGELRERHASGTPLSILSSVSRVTNLHGQVEGFIVVNGDVTAHRHERHQAEHDQLTGLPNRRRLDRELARAFTPERHPDAGLAVLFLDLDGFKPINDRYGHTAGDLVLCAVARRLADGARPYDTAGRLGGDEFLVILRNIKDAGLAEVVARRLRAAIEAPIELDPGTTVRVTASIGIAHAEHPRPVYGDAHTMLEAADNAMYAAKRGNQPIVTATPPVGSDD